MYEAKVICEFSSAHSLRNYGGKCEHSHGHNWKVEVVCASDRLDDTGLVIDFKVLKDKVNNLLDGLDHRDLNDIDYFKKFNPSSENIAYYVYMQLSKDTEITDQILLKQVNVWENDRSCASYYE